MQRVESGDIKKNRPHFCPMGEAAAGVVQSAGEPASPVPVDAASAHAPVAQRVINVGEVSKDDMTGLLREFLAKTIIPYLGPQSMYKDDEYLIALQLEKWNKEDKSFDDWYDLIDEMDSILGAKIPFTSAARDTHKIFNQNGVVYAVQGSYAAQLHGAPVDAGDIDFLVDNMLLANRVIVSSKLFVNNKGSFAVKKFQHKSGTEIDVAMAEEFGMSIGNAVTLGGIRVLNLYEVLLSLLLRPERRQKEHAAFVWLVLNRGEALSVNDKNKIAARTPYKEWSKLIETLNGK